MTGAILGQPQKGHHRPKGATSGTVKVATPGGTLSSNVPFHVGS
jgi:hypothetical protein